MSYDKDYYEKEMRDYLKSQEEQIVKECQDIARRMIENYPEALGTIKLPEGEKWELNPEWVEAGPEATVHFTFHPCAVKRTPIEQLKQTNTTRHDN